MENASINSVYFSAENIVEGNELNLLDDDHKETNENELEFQNTNPTQTTLGVRSFKM